MASWLRFERERLGLSRREMLRRSCAGSGGGLTRTVIEDIEGGRRLPTLRRVPPIARALGLPGWVVAEHAWLAPRVEEPWLGLRGRPSGDLIFISAGALPWDAANAAAAAAIALRDPGADGTVAASLLSAAWVRVGHPQLGLWQADRDGGENPRADLSRAEAEVALGRPETADRLVRMIGDWCGETELDRLRLAALRAESDLRARRFRRAAEQAIDLVDRRAGGRWLRVRAHRCLAGALQGLSREEDAREWLERARLLERSACSAPSDSPADAPPAHPR